MDEARCREVLEVPGDASLEDIQHAYHRLKRLYGDAQGAVLAPAMDEFSEEARARVLAELDRAFETLCRTYEAAHPPVHVVPPPVDPAHLPTDGPALRRVREASGATLEYLAAETHVRLDYLQALEEEHFEALPPVPVSVRGFLSAYLTELGLPVEPIAAAYMKRFPQGPRR